MYNVQEILDKIEYSASFAELKSTGVLPEPDADDGYYFISYSHKDYKKVFRDIIDFQKNGLKIWYDRGLESGKSWINEVKKKISSYYCRGVIFYISENYLASESCMLELEHVLKLLNKACLFVTLDGELGKDEQCRLYAPLLEHAPDDAAMLDVLLLCNDELAYEADIGRKIAYIECFREPALLEYTFIHGTNNPIFQAYNMFLGRSALVSGIIDKNVRSVTIPRTISHNGKTYKVHGIQGNAFSHCEQLEQVSLGDNWIMIMEDAFVHCPMLKRVCLGKPGRIAGTKVGMIQKCFLNCPQAELVLSDGEVSYNGTFKNRLDITEADFGGKVHLSGDCFSGCASLKSARLYKKDLMSEKMFYNCGSLEQVSIAKSNRSRWLTQTFYHCKSLRSVTLPPKLRTIGKQAFAGCTSLQEIVIPKKVKAFEPTAFEGCTALASVVLDCKRFSTLHRKPAPYHTTVYLDDVFGTVQRIYIKHPPKKTRLFRTDGFTKVKSDRRGYTLYQRSATC